MACWLLRQFEKKYAGREGFVGFYVFVIKRGGGFCVFMTTQICD